MARQTHEAKSITQFVGDGFIRPEVRTFVNSGTSNVHYAVCRGRIYPSRGMHIRQFGDEQRPLRSL
ncbi:MAG: hypothetical protein FWG87_12920 [Defluviitaleaceae bacterium]|nr:hypothetical protein [Defluviitaleaceae bacterium]